MRKRIRTHHAQIYIDAEDPRRSLSRRQAKQLIRQLIAGFQARSLRKGDCVCIHSFNDVSTTSATTTRLRPHKLSHAIAVLFLRRPGHYWCRACVDWHESRLHRLRVAAPLEDVQGEAHYN